MHVVDAQIHPVDAPLTEEVPGPVSLDIADPRERRDAAIAVSVALMDAVGVDAALVHPSAAFGHTAIDEIDAYAARHPDRFRGVASIDPASPTMAEEVRRARDHPAVVGLRAMVGWPPEGVGVARYRRGEYEGLFAAATEAGMPLFAFLFDALSLAGEIAERHPELRLVVDHIGIRQPPFYALPPDPWVELPALLALADRSNVALKLGGIPTLSREPYPFADVQPRVRAIVDAFGPERVMWASDHTRIRSHHSYAEALWFLRESSALSETEKALVLGGSLRRYLAWEERRACPSAA